MAEIVTAASAFSTGKEEEEEEGKEGERREKEVLKGAKERASVFLASSLDSMNAVWI